MDAIVLDTYVSGIQAGSALSWPSQLISQAIAEPNPYTILRAFCGNRPCLVVRRRANRNGRPAAKLLKCQAILGRSLAS
jgi:hypothetical protein